MGLPTVCSARQIMQQIVIFASHPMSITRVPAGASIHLAVGDRHGTDRLANAPMDITRICLEAVPNVHQIVPSVLLILLVPNVFPITLCCKISVLVA